jgi:RNA polymerase sigma-32 factor
VTDPKEPAEVLEAEVVVPDAAMADPSELADDADSPKVIEVEASGVARAVPARIATETSTPETVSALTRYMAELRHHAPISREEEHELAVRWHEEGDVEAARLMVLSNLRLVVKIAMEYRRAWTNTLDLIQEGNVGLMEAVQRFDPYKGVKLSSYGVYWVRAYILKYILDNMRSIRMGTTRAQRKLFFRLNKEKRELERQGYEAEPKLLAERLEVTEDDVIDMDARLSQPDISMSAPTLRGEGDATFGDFLPAPGDSAEENVGRAELRALFDENVRLFAKDLKERDRQILEERVLAEAPRTLADMGKEFGVSRERVRQLEARMLKRLREFMREKMVDFDFYASADED